MLRWIVCGIVLAGEAFTNVEHSSAMDAASEGVVVDADAVVGYVNRCRKPNGAFGPLDQEYSDAAWNYPAIRTLQQLGVEVANPEAIVEHGSGSPSGHAGNGHGQFFHHHGIRQALNRKIEPEHRLVEVVYATSKLGYYSNPLGPSDDLQFKAGGRLIPDPLDLALSKLSRNTEVDRADVVHLAAAPAAATCAAARPSPWTRERTGATASIHATQIFSEANYVFLHIAFLDRRS